MNRSIARTRAISAIALAVLAAGCGKSPLVRVANEKTPTSSMEAPSHAQRASFSTLADNRFEAACPDFPAKAVPQKTNVWCWAACAEMIHAYRGQPMSQQEIADRIHGAAPENATEEERKEAIRTATMDEILRALVPDLPPQALREASTALEAAIAEKSVQIDKSSYLESQIERRTVNSDIMIEDLLAAEPVVVGMRFRVSELDPAAAAASGQDPTVGHACVVYGAQFARTKAGVLDKVEDAGTAVWNVVKKPFQKDTEDAKRWIDRVPYRYDLYTVRMVDPIDGQTRDMDAQEFSERIVFMISATEARKILEKERIIEPAD